LTLFIDASVLVALTLREDDAEALLRRVGEGRRRLTSAVAMWETFRAVARTSCDADAARMEVDRLVEALDIELVPIGAPEAAEAARAHARYGKGTGHPARLNMGDCFAYACARTHGARLLYKGDDFVHTDMRAA